jgi:hypothetical protein
MSTRPTLFTRLARVAAVSAGVLAAGGAMPAFAQNASAPAVEVQQQAPALPSCRIIVTPSGVAAGLMLVNYTYHVDDVGPERTGQAAVCHSELTKHALTASEELRVQAQIKREHPERKDVVLKPEETVFE